MQSHLLSGILSDLHLGTLVAPPQRVPGGFMHKMVCLETTAGKYAVKLLNPAIMERPGVFENYRRAERIEGILQQNKIPIVPALQINGRKMQRAGNQYYYIVPWIEGKALRWGEIKREHCEAAGAILASIHKIEQRDEAFSRGEMRIDWNAYASMARTSCPEIAAALGEHSAILHSAQEAFNAALAKIPAVSCITNGDMDSKNVLWVDGNPFVIDLECLDYGNPFWDMFQLALSWSGQVICRIDYGLLEAFIASYFSVYGKISLDWNHLVASGFSWLEWLEYNIKRALWIECTDEEERKLGLQEAHQTIRRILYYHSIQEELLGHITAKF